MRRPLLAAPMLALIACSSSGPTQPDLAPELALSINAIEEGHVYVGDALADGRSLEGEHGATLFQVRLRERDRRHLHAVEHCEVRYQLPGQGRMHGGRRGSAVCWDDGTHGDDTPGDGIYHYLDSQDSIGCGRRAMPAGEYDYEFYCQFRDGTASALRVRVQRR